ncbi:MAG: DUF2194 domain-containing protein [Cetobacterium sp.]
MKSKYNFILIAMLFIVLLFQYFRVTNLEKYFTLNQKYNYELEKPTDGNFKIKSPIKYLVFYQKDSKEPQLILERWQATMNFSKVQYDIFDIATDEIIDFSKYSGIVFTNESFKNFRKDDYENIVKQVNNGASLFFLTRSFNNPFSKFAGIEKINSFKETGGIEFLVNIFPGFKDIMINKEVIQNSILDIEISELAKILVISNEKIPLIWEMKQGKGKIIYTNGSMFESKLAEGLMKQIIAYGSKVTIFPILNSKLVHFDDLPAPIQDIHFEPIFTEYRMGTREFFNTIWWNDMEGMAARNKLKYTTFGITKYNSVVNKDNIEKISKRNFEDLSRQGRNILKHGGELGIHGYNHYSLGLENDFIYEDYGYKPWTNIEDMKFVLKYFRNVLHELYGSEVITYTYVAPSNLISKTGKQALLETFPNLKSLSGIFYGAKEPGLLLQEVGRDTDYPELYSLPRFSSGLFKDDITMWSIYNAIASYGYVSHFLHPDDVTSEERGRNKYWSFLKDDFESIFVNLNKNLPLLKPATQSELNFEYSKLENIYLDYELFGDEILVNVKNFSGEIQSYIRVSGKKIKNIQGGEYKLVEKTVDYNLYLLDIKNNEIKIGLGDA